MQISDIINASDSYTDENTIRVQANNYINEAIAIINSKGFNLPLLKADEADYKAMPDFWQIRLLVNYVNYGVKMLETDLVEADRYERKFYEALRDFLTNGYRFIADEYVGFIQPDGTLNKDGIGGVYKLDTSGAINKGWFGRTTRGRQ